MPTRKYNSKKLEEHWESVMKRRSRKKERNARRHKEIIQRYEESLRNLRKRVRGTNAAEKPTEVLSIVKLVPRRKGKKGKSVTLKTNRKFVPVLSTIPESPLKKRKLTRKKLTASPIKGKATKGKQTLLFGPW